MALDTVHATTLYTQGLSFRAIAAAMGKNESTIRSYFKRKGMEAHETTNNTAPRVPLDGTDRTVVDTGMACEVTVKIPTLVSTEAEMLRHCNVDLTLWQRDRLEHRCYPIPGPDGKVTQGTYVKATFTRKVTVETPEAIAVMVDAIVAKRGVQPREPFAPAIHTSTGVMQLVCVADVHHGALSWSKSTGAPDYDLHISADLFQRATSYLMASGRGCAKRTIAVLGDYFHFDTLSGTTTGGTMMDRDSRIQRMLGVGADVLCEAIEASSRECLTEVIVVPGNHDSALSWSLQRILQGEFRRSPNVQIDGGFRSRKVQSYGRNMLVYAHGDKNKVRLMANVPTDYPEIWGTSRYREIHLGHLHTEGEDYKGTVSNAGVTARTHRSIKPADQWHADSEFLGSPRGMMALEYHVNGGLLGTRMFDPDLLAP
jgi:hypothetical protein